MWSSTPPRLPTASSATGAASFALGASCWIWEDRGEGGEEKGRGRRGHRRRSALGRPVASVEKEEPAQGREGGWGVGRSWQEREGREFGGAEPSRSSPLPKIRCLAPPPLAPPSSAAGPAAGTASSWGGRRAKRPRAPCAVPLAAGAGAGRGGRAGPPPSFAPGERNARWAFLRPASLGTQNGCRVWVACWRTISVGKYTVRDPKWVWVAVCVFCWRQSQPTGLRTNLFHRFIIFRLTSTGTRARAACFSMGST